MSEECNPAEVLSLLGDEHVRAILSATSEQPMSVKSLTDHCDASLPTLYRRIERLLECEMLVERVEVAADGNHFRTYEARVEHVSVDIVDGEIDVECSTDEDAVDRFTRFWKRARGEEE